ncbi:MAG: hypothetical protein CME69_04165 [Halobacteriovorax sp.]|nr:hypothetical protein [Halobacteriovorax sp.]|tara:strand:- start:538 stop:1146 length:609 start_codon:yes stop_codon:yes gene_type:complete
MKKLLSILAITAVSSMTVQANTVAENLYKAMIPTGSDSATWESECKLSMKTIITVNNDKTFEMGLKAYSSANCEEGTEYISLSRNGEYEYQKAVYDSYSYDDGAGSSHSYTYQVSPEQLSLNLSSIKVDSEGLVSDLANGVLSMYQGCFGEDIDVQKTYACDQSGLAKTKSRVKLSNMTFITPTKVLADFRDDVKVEFTLVK